MNRYVPLVLIFFLLTSCTTLDEQQKVRIQTLETDTTRVIVSFKDQIVEQVVEESAGEIIEVMDTVPVLTANIPTDELNDLEENPQVEHVEEDQVIMIQNEQVSWGMNRISVGSAWNSALTGKGVSVAVIDTGIDRNHQDLKVVGGVSTVDYTDSYHDDNGHGTHVAGIIAALHNGIGIRGVAPDIELFSVKALDETGAGYVSDIVSAIDWSIRNNIDIINLSIGMPRHSHSLETIVNRAYERGALLVGAAGNYGTTDITLDNVFYPAKYNSVIAVGATDSQNARGRFSSQVNAYSATGPTLEIAAPGVAIYSTYPNNRYQNMNGTSMAAPFVTGALAVLKEAYPTQTNQQLRQRLRETVLDLGVVNRDPVFGYGLLQVPKNFRSIVELHGKDRYLTGVEIARRGWSQRAEVVVLGRGDQPIDALTASVLASKFHSPLLLSRPDYLRDEVRAELKRLMPKEIYIAGGTAAISAAIEREIRAMGFSVKRIGGQNRFDTAVQIATEVGVANQIFLTTANEQSPDALSIAPYAGLKQIPILLTRRDQLSKTVVDFIVRNNINHVTLIGGTQAISDQIREQLSALNVRTIERISGDTRFGTSVKIAERYASDFDFSNISIASGRSFIDALPGSPYASMQKAPILLTDRTRLPMEVRSWMEQQRLSRTTFTFLGGYGVITDEVRKEFLY